MKAVNSRQKVDNTVLGELLGNRLRIDPKQENVGLSARLSR